ncbi:hypothetical protein N5T78_07860 [Aliarcobacter cryaerophilus]|uniref:hypothetical protein n=1 Tax=Aliarcobacter cryaerophilus TaxID=28198 RepID=UPI0021B64508|nr:hypothetical protein [Aliarcobacter cryaerophilus]MCT7466488.1 hypothetical protein [Aliarcobacter cryaerophilus]
MKNILSLLTVMVIGNVYAYGSMDSIYRQVINDSIEQYEMVKRQGDPIEQCVYAGLVVASYLQAKDEEGYRIWKKIEKNDCAKAGI